MWPNAVCSLVFVNVCLCSFLWICCCICVCKTPRLAMKLFPVHPVAWSSFLILWALLCSKWLLTLQTALTHTLWLQPYRWWLTVKSKTCPRTLSVWVKVSAKCQITLLVFSRMLQLYVYCISSTVYSLLTETEGNNSHDCEEENSEEVRSKCSYSF